MDLVKLMSKKPSHSHWNARVKHVTVQVSYVTGWSNIGGGYPEAMKSSSLQSHQNWIGQGPAQSLTHCEQEVGLSDLWSFLPNKIIFLFCMLS